jgi:ribonuclease Z
LSPAVSYSEIVRPNGLRGYSRALYSNWLWHQPLQLVIDAGEGLALALGSHVFSPSVIALTHGHSDHVLGLPGFAGARRFGKGAPDKPWTVLYPAGSRGVEAIRQTIADLWPDVVFPITWTALESGATHRLNSKQVIESFAVTHVPPDPAVGYRVLETRRRLKPAFSDLPQSEIERLSRQRGREHMMEAVAHVVFAHSGDAMPVDAALVANADTLVHDATFLEPGDRRAPIHASSREVFELAREAHVRTLILNHLSIRYERSMARARLREQLMAAGFSGDCFLLDEGELVNLR